MVQRVIITIPGILTGLFPNLHMHLSQFGPSVIPFHIQLNWTRMIIFLSFFSLLVFIFRDAPAPAPVEAPGMLKDTKSLLDLAHRIDQVTREILSHDIFSILSGSISAKLRISNTKTKKRTKKQNVSNKSFTRICKFFHLCMSND